MREELEHIEHDEVDGLTVEEKVKTITSILNHTWERLDKDYPILADVYEQVYSRLHTILLMKRFTENELEKARQMIHISDSITTGITNYTGEVDEEFEKAEEKTFGLFYGIHDTILQLMIDGELSEMREEKTDEGTD